MPRSSVCPIHGWGARAFVICREGQSLDMKSLERFLGECGVAKVYWPARREIVNQLPRTANGEVRKADLRARLAAEKSA